MADEVSMIPYLAYSLLESPCLFSSILRRVSGFITSDGGAVRCAKGGDEHAMVLRDLLWDTVVDMEGVRAANHHCIHADAGCAPDVMSVGSQFSCRTVWLFF